MEGVMGPRESGQYITENSKDVFILDKGVQQLAVVVSIFHLSLILLQNILMEW